jgi:hypothetical protein
MDIQSDTCKCCFDVLSNLFHCVCLCVYLSVCPSVSGALGLPAAHGSEARLRSVQDLLTEGKGCGGRRRGTRDPEGEGEEEENEGREEAGRPGESE